MSAKSLIKAKLTALLYGEGFFQIKFFFELKNASISLKSQDLVIKLLAMHACMLVMNARFNSMTCGIAWHCFYIL